jgi:MFS transporter, FHS family, glucose/mannose:H+ symporter
MSTPRSYTSAHRPAASAEASLASLSAAAYAGMFVFGIVMALLGAVLPELSARLQFSLGSIGTLFLVMNFAMLLTSLIVGAAMDRFGMKPPLAVAPWLVAGALLIIAAASRYEALLPAVVLLGIGGGALNGATNVLVADLHDDPRRKASALNLLGVFFGFGALFLPFTFGALLAALGSAVLLYAAAGLCIATAAYAALLRFPAPKQPQRVPMGEMPRFITMPVVLAIALLLFFESGNEFMLGGYISMFFTRELGRDVATASWSLAAYWAAIMAARILLSRLLLRVSAHSVIVGGAIAAAIGAVITGTSGHAVTATAGAVLTGAALAGIYPSVLGVAGTRFREHSGTVFGILFTIALAGGMTMPWLAGQLAESAGMRWVFALVTVNFSAIAVLAAIVKRLHERNRID